MEEEVLPEEILTNEFWKELSRKLFDWATTDLPGVILLIILLIVSLKLCAFLIKRLKKFLVQRTVYHADDAGPDMEIQKRVNTLMEIVRKGVAVIVWTVFMLMILKKLNINITPILTGVGIIGLAVGFGAQELVRDFITGFFILLENQIRTGDVANLNGVGGVVEKIELRTITLRDASGTVHVFQNGKINTIANLTKGWSAMVFDIGVAYKEDLNNVMKIMKDVSEDLRNDENFKSKILEPMEIYGLDNFGDSALIIKGRIKTKPAEQWTVGREYRKRLKEAFDINNIEIPFPQQTVYWREGADIAKLTGTGQEQEDQDRE